MVGAESMVLSPLCRTRAAATVKVVAGAGVPAQLRQGDAVEAALVCRSPPVQPVTGGFARGCLHGAGAAEGGEGCLAVQPVGVVADGDEQGGRRVDPQVSLLSVECSPVSVRASLRGHEANMSSSSKTIHGQRSQLSILKSASPLVNRWGGWDSNPRPDGL